jgi:hypothetical protein
MCLVKLRPGIEWLWCNWSVRRISKKNVFAYAHNHTHTRILTHTHIHTRMLSRLPSLHAHSLVSMEKFRLKSGLKSKGLSAVKPTSCESLQIGRIRSVGENGARSQSYKINLVDKMTESVLNSLTVFYYSLDYDNIMVIKTEVLNCQALIDYYFKTIIIL